MRIQWQFVFLWLFFKSTLCSDKPICTDIISECQRRAGSRLAGVSDDQIQTCIYLETTLGCSEEYMCDCSRGRVTTAALDDWRGQHANYLRICSGVVGYTTLRTKKKLACEGHLKKVSRTGDFMVQDNQMEGGLRASVSHLDATCPGYAACQAVYMGEERRIQIELISREQALAMHCEASKQHVTCSERAFCACGLAGNTQLKQVFTHIRGEHHAQCGEELRVGFLDCKAAPHALPLPPDFDQLCEFPVTACKARQADHSMTLTEEQYSQGGDLVMCELLAVNTACTEDYLCLCPGMQREELVAVWEDGRREYEGNCSTVPGHNLRMDGIKCKESITDDSKVDTEKDINLGEVEAELTMDVKVREMDRRCPGYERCYNHTEAYNARALQQGSEAEQRVLVCEGSRLNTLCLDDVLCGCGLGGDHVAAEVMRSLRHNHETYCLEKLNTGYLNCNAKPQAHHDEHLCVDFVTTCERRVIEIYSGLIGQPHALVSCATFHTRVQCFEDFVCGCPGMNTQELMDNFDKYRQPYTDQCSNVAGHTLRGGELVCKEKIISTPKDGSYGSELKSEEQVSQMGVAVDLRMINVTCGGVTQCRNVSLEFSAARRDLETQCLASRYTVVCLEDTLCACGLRGHAGLQADMRAMRADHQRVCGEELTVGYLTCIGSELRAWGWVTVALAVWVRSL